MRIVSIDSTSARVESSTRIDWEQIKKHREIALRRSADDQDVSDEQSLRELVTDRWDENATLFCIVSGSGNIIGSVRIAAQCLGQLPVDELYELNTKPDDVEIGRTTIHPAHRGGILASMLLFHTMRYLDTTSPTVRDIYVDPIIGAKRGIAVSTLQDMGFEVASRIIFDRRYNLSSQALKMSTNDIPKIWQWRQRTYGQGVTEARHKELLLGI